MSLDPAEKWRGQHNTVGGSYGNTKNPLHSYTTAIDTLVTSTLLYAQTHRATSHREASGEWRTSVSALHALKGCTTISKTEFSIFSDFFHLYMACLDFNPSAIPKDTTDMSSEITETWVQILTLPHTSYSPWGMSLITSLSRCFLICKLSLLEIPTSVVRAGRDTCKSLKSAAGPYSVNKYLLSRFSMP